MEPESALPTGEAAGGEHPLELFAVLDALVADGLLAADRAAALKAGRGARGSGDRHPLALIAERNWPRADAPARALDLETLTGWLARRAGLPHQVIDPLKVDVTAITGVMSYAYARRWRILAVEAGPEAVVIATAQPWVRAWENELAHVLGRPIRRVVTSPAAIDRYLLEFYTLSRSVRRAEDAEREGRAAGVQNLEQLMELGRRGELDANDQHVINIVDWLLQYAFGQRASDIHLEPRREQGNVRFRIDGVLHTVYEIPAPVLAAVTSRIKILGRMDVAEKRRPQDGRIKTRSPDGAEVELRLSSLPTAFGEKLVLRIFDPGTLVQDYRELGFSGEEERAWRGLITQPHGIVLVTGPTGSGKTTTLYSTLKVLARPEVNVCTVEDPIEMVEPAFNQMQVHHAIGLDFAAGVRTLLRQDPDIIMVGEIRDRETAEMAVQAALTGHLVFSTLHTNDAVSAVTRLMEIGVPPYLINATLLGVLAQRLVRTLCPHCKASVPVDETAWQSLVSPWKAELPERVHGPVGCLECRQTGYLGRTGVYELLRVTEGLKALIGPDCALKALRQQALRDGLRPLRLSGARKVARGETTVEEVLRVAPPSQL